MRSRSPGDAQRGSVTAEFAAAVPAVILLLAGCLVCLQVAGHQLRLQDAAADVARSLSRGGDTEAAGAVPGATVSVSHRGDLLCVRLSSPSSTPVGAWLGLTLSATSCALAGGK
jgi:hypothetical protein